MSTLTSKNPVFAKDTFTQFEHSYAETRSAVMTVQGTMGKTFLLLGILFTTAIISWRATVATARCRSCRSCSEPVSAALSSP